MIKSKEYKLSVLESRILFGTIYSDELEEILTCGLTIEGHSVQSTMMGDFNNWVDNRGSLNTVYNDGEISTWG